jgi:hypothetical protein
MDASEEGGGKRVRVERSVVMLRGGSFLSACQTLYFREKSWIGIVPVDVFC